MQVSSVSGKVFPELMLHLLLCLLQVLLRGAPDWESCLAVVNTVVNASTPCAVHEHLPTCVLGTPQPELQGNFMALTGTYCRRRVTAVQCSADIHGMCGFSCCSAVLHAVRSTSKCACETVALDCSER
jgi:hypothetical protein